MEPDDGGSTNDRDSFIDADDDLALEPEISRWLTMYAEAADGRRDATVAAIFDEVNRLLRRYRRESAAHVADYGARLRTLTEQMPILLWTTDTRLRVTTFAGSGLAAVDIDPMTTVSLPLSSEGAPRHGRQATQCRRARSAHPAPDGNVSRRQLRSPGPKSMDVLIAAGARPIDDATYRDRDDQIQAFRLQLPASRSESLPDSDLLACTDCARFLERLPLTPRIP